MYHSGSDSASFLTPGQWVVATAIGLIIVNDILATSAMCYHLFSLRSGVERENHQNTDAIYSEHWVDDKCGFGRAFGTTNYPTAQVLLSRRIHGIRETLRKLPSRHVKYQETFG